jgi:PAS domain S-box-containing protein
MTSQSSLTDQYLETRSPGILTFGGARMAILDVVAGFWALRRQIEALVGQHLAESVLQQSGANGGASFAAALIEQSGLDDRQQALRDCIAAYQAAGFGRFEIQTFEYPIGQVTIRVQDAFESWAIRQRGQVSDHPVCAYTAGVLVGFVNVIDKRQDIVCIEHQCQAQGAKHCFFELLPRRQAGDVPVVALDPDPGLGRQLNLLEMLFDRMPMGIAIFDRELRLRRCNPTWASFIQQYTQTPLSQVVPGKSFFELAPGNEPEVIPLFERVLQGETVIENAFEIESDGIISYWDTVFTPLVEHNEVVGILDVAIDATERIRVLRELEETTERLRLREERLDLVMRGTNDGIWDWDLQTDQVYYSPRWMEMLGYAANEWPATLATWRKLVHPEDLDMAINAVEKHIAGETSQYVLEHRLHHKDGSYRWILARGMVTHDETGIPLRMIGAHTDITDRKTAEAALQENRRVLATLMDNLPGMVYRASFEPDRLIQFASQGSLDLTGYSPAELQSRLVFNQLLHPADRALVWEAIQSALSAGNAHQVTYRIRTRQGQEKWVTEQGQAVRSAQGDRIALEGFVTDVTERVMAQQLLEQRVEERTHELATLLQVSHNVASTLDLETLLAAILDQLQEVVQYSGATIFAIDDDELYVVAHRGPISPARYRQMRFPYRASASRDVILDRRALIIEDVRGDTPVAHIYRKVVGDEMHTTFAYIRSWLSVPLAIKDRVIGVLSLDHGQPSYYNEHHAQLAHAFANQVAVLIENARLYREEQERRRIAESLREILAALNSDRPLDEILAFIVEQAGRLLLTDAAVLYRLQQAQQELRAQASWNLDAQYAQELHIPVGKGATGKAVEQRQPVAIIDAQDKLADWREPGGDPHMNALLAGLARAYPSLLSVPLLVKDGVYGALTLYYRQPHHFTPDEIDLAATFASQAALAIENASLRQQVEASAVLTERTRLARDLHDAVTQTLFSASLIAEVLPRLWERDPAEGLRRLEEIRQLTRGALAEMRALLLELRPAALVEADLNELFRHLVDAFTGRARVPARLELEGDGDYSAEVKVFLYRIAQEALNNVNKHAEASQVMLRLVCVPERVEMVIQDDGRGFDPSAIASDSMGMGIMRERAEALGAQLTIVSQPGSGTQVIVQLAIPKTS